MTATEIITSWAKFSNEDEKLAERERIFQEGIKRKPALKKATTRSNTMPLKKAQVKKQFQLISKQRLKLENHLNKQLLSH